MAQQPHVLIIEDDPWQADIHTRRLQAAGYSVAVAHSPVQAMQAALQHTPQVIVADVLLSGNTILLLLNELQSDRALGAIPVVLCTNQAELVPPGSLAAYGVVQVLSKTAIHPGDVVRAVKRAQA